MPSAADSFIEELAEIVAAKVERRVMERLQELISELATPNPAEELPQNLTVNETAKFLRISKPTVDRLISKGSLPSFTIGSRRRVRREDLIAYVDSLVRGSSR
ncbi:helix-turn-helix domain-containing protein [Paenibacillus oryzisoli]|uniref:helix-turn-helix domain-containing protein n=1 Tax=Paenibacillus oryzisoli TaxID=1850517 RepID=UPI003D2AB0C5